MEPCVTLLTAVMVVTIFILVFAAIFFNASNKRKRWTEIAQALGLTHNEGPFLGVGSIEGEYHGYWVRIDTFTSGSGKNSKTYTRIQTFHNPPLGLGLNIYREGIFSGFGKMLGFQDIEVGDRQFDDRFTIKGQDEESVIKLLDADVRQQLMLYDERVGPLNVNDERVYYQRRGVLTDQATITHVLSGQQVVAQRLTRAFTQNAAQQVYEPAYQVV
ncbi:MAG: hypothetical protein AAFS10_05160 [Myxococcota bacterium]